MEEVNSKQQVTEVLRAAETVVVATSSKADSDQIASTIALTQMMDKLGKRPEPIYSGEIPSNLSFLPTDILHKQFNGLRDFIIELDTSKTEADKLKYVPDGKRLKIYITPFNGNFNKEDLGYSYGDYHCDAVIMVGAKTPGELDKALAGQKQLLDKTRLISILAGSQAGTPKPPATTQAQGAKPAPAPPQLTQPAQANREVQAGKQINWHEPLASSISEMLMSLTEALQPGLLDNHIATSLLTGIVGATDHFTAANTTPKVMTMAAQLMAAGADQGSIIKHLERPLPSPAKNPPDFQAGKPQAPKISTPDRELKPSQEKALPHHPPKPVSAQPSRSPESPSPAKNPSDFPAGKPELPASKPEPPPTINKPRDYADTPANPNPPPKFPGANEPAHIADQPLRSIPPHPPTTPTSTAFPPPPPAPLPHSDPNRPVTPPAHSPVPPAPKSQDSGHKAPTLPPTLDVESARRAVEEATRDLPQQ